MSRRTLATLALLLASRLAPAGQEPPASAECTSAPDVSQVVRVRFQASEGAVIGAASAAVTYPTTSLVIPGTGSSLPSDTRVSAPAGAMFSLRDENGTLKVLVASGTGMEGEVVARIRFRRCVGAAVPTDAALGCTVMDAADDKTNLLSDVTCSATLE